MTPIPPDLQEKLEDFECQYGPARGKLALAMDLLTDAQVAAGQLTIYCRAGMDVRKPHPDLVLLQRQLDAIQHLVKSAFRDGKAPPGAKAPTGE